MPRYTASSAFGTVLDVKPYMDYERTCRSFHDFFRKHGCNIELPSSFDPQIFRAWQRMNHFAFAKYTFFSAYMLRRLHRLECELAAIDNAAVGYCIRGCVQKCLKEDMDAKGQERTPLIEQFYLHLPNKIELVRVSRRPITAGRIDQHHQLVIEEEVFQQRKDELVKLCRWEAKRATLQRYRMPLSVAGERPTLTLPQEDLSSLEMGDQQCQWKRTPILNEDWPGFATITPTVDRCHVGKSEADRDDAPLEQN